MPPDKDKLKSKNEQLRRISRRRGITMARGGVPVAILALDKTDPKPADIQTIFERMYDAECLVIPLAEDDGLDIVLIRPVVLDPRETREVESSYDRFLALYPLATMKATLEQVLAMPIP